MLIPPLSEKPMASAPRVANAGQTPDFAQMLAKAQSDAPAPKATGKLDLESLTTDEAYGLMTDMADSGALTPEEYQNMAAVLYIRLLNQSLGYAVPARFNLLSGVQALIENSKMICRHDQVRAETHGLQVLRAYQANA